MYCNEVTCLMYEMQCCIPRTEPARETVGKVTDGRSRGPGFDSLALLLSSGTETAYPSRVGGVRPTLCTINWVQYRLWGAQEDSAL